MIHRDHFFHSQWMVTRCWQSTFTVWKKAALSFSKTFPSSSSKWKKIILVTSTKWHNFHFFLVIYHFQQHIRQTVKRTNLAQHRRLASITGSKIIARPQKFRGQCLLLCQNCCELLLKHANKTNLASRGFRVLALTRCVLLAELMKHTWKFSLTHTKFIILQQMPWERSFPHYRFFQHTI